MPVEMRPYVVWKPKVSQANRNHVQIWLPEAIEHDGSMFHLEQEYSIDVSMRADASGSFL